jgi:hypothetical protein
MEIVYYGALNRLIHQFTLNFHDRGNSVDLLLYPLFCSSPSSDIPTCTVKVLSWKSEMAFWFIESSETRSSWTFTTKDSISHPLF